MDELIQQIESTYYRLGTRFGRCFYEFGLAINFHKGLGSLVTAGFSSTSQVQVGGAKGKI